MHFVCCLVVVTNRVISHRKYQVRVLPMLDGTSSVLSNGSASCHMSTPATYTMCVWTVHTVGEEMVSWRSLQDRLENGTQDVERRTRIIQVGMIGMIAYRLHFLGMRCHIYVKWVLRGSWITKYQLWEILILVGVTLSNLLIMNYESKWICIIRGSQWHLLSTLHLAC